MIENELNSHIENGNEKEFFEKITIPVGKSTCWPNNAGIYSIRNAIRTIFPRKEYEKSPVWAWSVESWNSFHDPRPDKVAFNNKTGQEIFLKVPILNDIHKMIGRWELSRKNNNERNNMDNFNNELKTVRENNVSNSIETNDALISAENIVSVENELENNSFEYLTLDPKSETIPAYDLGIEITIPKLAKDRVNLDPQHGPSGNPETSAIEEAMNYDLTKLEDRAKIATVRPDADSVGAMAVLELRKAEIEFDENLVKTIGRVDALGIKRAKTEYPEIEVRQKELSYANVKCFEKLPLAEKVIAMKKLLTNKVEWQEIEKAWSEIQAKKETAKQRLTIKPLLEDYAVMIEGNHPMAFDLGYENAGIVAAFNPNFKRPWIENDTESQKWTIARYSEKEPIDIKGLSVKLNELEKEYNGTGSWGGPANLIASPQGDTSKIPFEEIVKTIKQFIKIEF